MITGVGGRRLGMECLDVDGLRALLTEGQQLWAPPPIPSPLREGKRERGQLLRCRAQVQQDAADEYFRTSRWPTRRIDNYDISFQFCLDNEQGILHILRVLFGIDSVEV
ncbi:MAG: hypothetical protein C0392_06790 [Syntrophus sp. (in: bacteria)]|nr:hypothetical protein [Syntrophus sp. (in: bacteria)]